jgi:hypothetical protein
MTRNIPATLTSPINVARRCPDNRGGRDTPDTPGHDQLRMGSAVQVCRWIQLSDGSLLSSHLPRCWSKKRAISVKTSLVSGA